ncbi:MULTISPECIES: RluA family pseudouridine synthase [unclassified Chelatococcus]|jgi:23S rRNA pseudouridine1911/1915/1917 synthase|uniref:RluA family pseudouridine synthase n=1 Tax=unclassified Chelatococcus TaxID=2638111 RepID=UPI001BCED773|nr:MULTISPECIES: RluA family pseudouridine synthase [unclassified Chelatococcus]CAH1660229.1 Ribosomal large subunit pseudouridine synthase D [Hyphomicrobiales bacterium]MBS7741067.1 RluA family pseudouridine synthase [Chelatococcus sp. HY11]MBX3545253.1 RluA family pseudouridine synthase [Chelatococcus sp.]MCO5077887.1 RluA family pseudouridine synthase [Chelatococcus sp.]CAH1683522.1 Ribosomal large subunit pseudouridine synthase D [Hyphomicrobiales bacterium]
MHALSSPAHIASEQIQTVVVADDLAGDRLDRFLAAAFSDLSRSRLQQLVRAGQVRIDGAVVEDPKHKVTVGATVTLVVPPAAPAEPEPETIPLTVLYEDNHIIVIDKPAGLVVHPAPGHASGTLVNALLAHCGDSLSGIGGVRRPGIVHRLDKDTSGVMVVAKTDQAHAALSAQFADHGRTGPLERVYTAVVWGILPTLRGTIDQPIERATHNREKMTVTREGRGRIAITHYEVDRVFRGDEDRGMEPIGSFVRCRLETGRTHQIRVHMAHIGHPLLGDQLYGRGFKTKESLLGPAARSALEILGRQALHARTLGFAHPATGEFMSFESAPPEDLARLVAALPTTRPKQ